MGVREIKHRMGWLSAAAVIFSGDVFRGVFEWFV
jgi:hypothetical protein